MSFIGIDIGRTSAQMSLFTKLKGLEAIPNDLGSNSTPSCIAFDEDKVLIGQAALDYSIDNPGRVITNFTHLVGRKYSSLSKDFIKNHPNKLMPSDRDEIMIEACGDLKSPVILYSQLLNKLKEDAELYLGKSIVAAVITVPHYFTSK